MNILFISKKGLASNLAFLLKKEGHHVKFFMDDRKLKGVFDNMVEKTKNWKRELFWVGKEGLIVFDDNGYGKTQDRLRKEGYSVFGGCESADRLEYDREFTHEIFGKYNIETNDLKTFKNVAHAVSYVKNNPAQYIIKREGDNSKFVTYVGVCEDGKDVLEILEKYSQNRRLAKESISLQIKASGIEIGVGRYFNGDDWVGPIEMNLEHPHLFAGSIGPFTDEMGTLAWYTENENRIYTETLAKLKPFLKEIKYKGDIEVNAIVNESGIYALETTPRIGCPIVHIHSALHISPWGELFKAVADGKSYDLKYKEGYSVVFSVAVPPFPFQKHFKTNICDGLTIFMNNVTEEDFKHIHLDEVGFNSETKSYYITKNTEGFILYVTGHGQTVEAAREQALTIIKKIHIPKMFYRIDIGESFAKYEQKLLIDWGYL